MPKDVNAPIRTLASLNQNQQTEAYKQFWDNREKLRCSGKSTTCCERECNHHEKHKAKCIPEDYGDPCVIKQCNPHHRQLRFPENMGLADPHYVAHMTRRKRRPSRPLEKPCCHGDDYETDSDDEEESGEIVPVHYITKTGRNYVFSMTKWIPAICALFVMWMFLMNWAIYGKGPADTER